MHSLTLSLYISPTLSLCPSHSASQSHSVSHYFFSLFFFSSISLSSLLVDQELYVYVCETGCEIEGGPLPSLLCLGEGRLPQGIKGRLAFLFKKKEGITLLGKGKELLAPVLAKVSALFPPKGVTDVRQRLWLAEPKATQDQRRTTHGSIESCHEGKELLKEELPRAESRPLSKQQAQGVQGASQSHQRWPKRKRKPSRIRGHPF